MIHAFESSGKRKMVWLISQPIGSGAFGTVYSVYKNKKTSTEPEYAVKIIPSTRDGIASLSEAVVMTCLEHPHLNSALDILVEPERICIFQQRAVGTLAENILSSTDEMKKKWSFQLTSAIKYLSTLNLIHGDIKASNILLYSSGDIKLADFGLITKVDDIAKRKVYTRTHRPPEVWHDNTIKLASDVWALGATLFEIYTNSSVVPPEVETYEQALPFIESISRRIQHLPKDLIEVLESCLVPIERRLNIHDLIKLDYFKSFEYQPGSIKGFKHNSKLKNYTKLINTPVEYIEKINHIANCLNKFKTRLLPKFTDEHKIEIATLLTYKLYNKPIPDKFRYNSLWFKLEREVCSYLGFMLWS